MQLPFRAAACGATSRALAPSRGPAPVGVRRLSMPNHVPERADNAQLLPCAYSRRAAKEKDAGERGAELELVQVCGAVYRPAHAREALHEALLDIFELCDEL